MASNSVGDSDFFVPFSTCLFICFLPLQIFGAIDEEQAIGFPVAGKTAAANVRLSLVVFFIVLLIKSFLQYHLTGDENKENYLFI